MEIFAMIFAILMIAAAITATALIGMVTGFWWGLGFAVFLVVIYSKATYQSGPTRRMTRKSLNAFQRPLADD